MLRKEIEEYQRRYKNWIRISLKTGDTLGVYKNLECYEVATEILKSFDESVEWIPNARAFAQGLIYNRLNEVLEESKALLDLVLDRFIELSDMEDNIVNYHALKDIFEEGMF